MVDNYVPDRGDLIWLDFDPKVGHEQAGHRPAVVVSKKEYNLLTGSAVVCPISSKYKNFALEVEFNGSFVSGSILVHHFKNTDWRFRKARFIEKLDEASLREVQGVMTAIVNR